MAVNGYALSLNTVLAHPFRVNPLRRQASHVAAKSRWIAGRGRHQELASRAQCRTRPPPTGVPKSARLHTCPVAGFRKDPGHLRDCLPPPTGPSLPLPHGANISAIPPFIPSSHRLPGLDCRAVAHAEGRFNKGHVCRLRYRSAATHPSLFGVLKRLKMNSPIHDQP